MGGSGFKPRRSLADDPDCCRRITQVNRRDRRGVLNPRFLCSLRSLGSLLFGRRRPA
jgi:hypothetical protein